VSIALLAALVGASILVGVGNMLSPVDAWRAIVGTQDTPRLHELAIQIRVPRALLAVIAGGSLAAAGALLQALTRNPLASPDLTGLSAGAIAAVIAWAAFGPSIAFGTFDLVIPAVATTGGVAAAAAVYVLTRRFGAIESNRLLLTGILVGGVLSSVSTVSLLVLRADADQFLGFLTGTLALKTWTDAAVAATYVAPGVGLVLLSIPRANALQLGDAVAVSLGQRRESDRFFVLLAAVVLTAGVVSVTGGIGFVGLLGPHIVRRWVGSDLRRLVPAAALAGAVMVLAADLVARNFHPGWIVDAVVGMSSSYTPAQLPVGIYLNLFGVPFLVSLLWRRTR
jgi:iron complex transport system permease protein